jgi:lipopolysaccharide biosynthesis glycosyltransferase
VTVRPGGDEAIVVAACFNEAYVPHVATMMRSAATATPSPGRWYLIGDDSVGTVTERELVAFAVDCGIEAVAFRIPEPLLAGFDNCPPYPRVVWNRSVLGEALSDERRVVYLDSDIIVLRDLRGLWAAEIDEGDLFAAVCHPSYVGGNSHLATLGLGAAAPYFNSGVMVMDLEAMRAEGVAEGVRRFAVRSDRPPLRYPEQDTMNALYAGRWTSIDPTWNSMTSIVLPFLSGSTWADDVHHPPGVLERAATDPAIVHFEGPAVLKPWHRRCFNPYASEYRRYRAMTPWPLARLDGRRRDLVFAQVPARLQARLFRARDRRAGSGAA